ncbi:MULTISPECIES: A24 family peptidase [unclassified Caulobacter]|jgi:leader peptidase (prepilin peptidase)/N-methyltransferase|uniref:prepilin peptidase n=1 Tax=unclassified Caulobacter TaxID=2648921 RepID=UPI0006F3C5B9|nr:MULTISPECIES: A24 family peptidase [unclassified Caulobacter]KQV58690.1 hypothetical protein ASC62_07910 [Caulobacter sp. Root342]KQV68801.1 hypothetical protein ASC70_08125 [Caulobacter sp. Root343]
MFLALPVLGGALGCVVASYVTTMALRQTDAAAPAGPRSACDGCRRPLRFSEMAPIVSYVALAGCCRTCAAPISLFHPLGELAGLVLGAAVMTAAPDWRALMLAPMAACLLASAVIDARTRILPTKLTAVVALLGAGLAFAHGPIALVEGLVSAGLIAGLMILIRKASRRWRGHIGVGLGDVRLLCAFALWLGVAAWWMIFAAYALAVIVVALRGRGDGRIAMGPMIAASGMTIGLLMESGLWPRLL